MVLGGRRLLDVGSRHSSLTPMASKKEEKSTLCEVICLLYGDMVRTLVTEFR